MLSLATRRLLAALPLAWGVATLVFFLSLAVPGRTFHELEGPQVAPRAAEQLRALFGADRSIAQRYVAWLGASLTGDLGISFSFRAPVRALLREALLNSLLLTTLALLLQFVAGTAAALLAFRSRWLDRILVAAASLLYSLPSYCLGIALVGVFSIGLGWLPVSQMHSIDAPVLPAGERMLDTLRHLLLPALTLCLPAAAGIALYVREQLRSLASRPFVVAARARGAGRRRVLLAHALRNALLPIVVLLGLSLPGLVGGAAVVEVLYAWPGMGRLAYQAVLSRDLPLILGCTLFGSFAVIVGSLLSDLAALALDPRIERGAA